MDNADGCRKIISISVPLHWDTVIDKTKLADEFSSLRNLGLMVIFLGANSQTGSNVIVLSDMNWLMSAEPQAIDRNEYMQSQLADLKQLGAYDISQKDITLDGISGTQFHYSIGERWDQIATILLGDEPRMACGSIGVALTVTSPAMGKYAAAEAELAVVEQVVASLRILPTAAIAPTCDDRKALSLLEESGDSVGATEYIVEVDGLRLLEWEAVDVNGYLDIVGTVENVSSELIEYIY